ncbi:MAG: L,D-transpeptidase family protein, partial [Daejeonella sp.]
NMALEAQTLISFARSLMKFLYRKVFLCVIFIPCCSLNGCSQPTKKAGLSNSINKSTDQTVTGNFSSQSALVFDSIQISHFFAKYLNIKEYENDVRSFYRKRNFSFAWFEKGLLIEQAGNLSSRILNLENDGIYKKLFYKQALDSLMYSVNLPSEAGKLDINLELLLTSEYFVYSKLAWEGMSEDVRKSNKWYLPRKTVDYDKYLDSLLESPSNTDVVNEPVYRQYNLLRSHLRKYRELETSGDWDPIVNNENSKIGDSSRVIAQIKKRLFQFGDFKGDISNHVFNSQLSNALINFQQRNGLIVDGQLNKETILAINVPLKNRIKQILVNMERSRWLPVKLDSDYLAVNIPEFKLHVYHADSLLWSCNAVVGQTVHPTTLFYGEIKYVVFSPYWNIPPGILRNEIIPGMKKSSSYLANHHMEITGYQGGLPVVRQKPGPSNALGLVKFLFPNSYNIYLHDTPSKSLFNETSRAFSHGCIRIEEPAKLAAFLLNDMDEWNPEKITKAMHAGKERYVALRNKVPVFISYFTAFIDRDNKLNFRRDIYNLDERLASMIISGEGLY